MGDEMKDRLREAFENDSQKIISEKLNISQGNVSKLLSGNQQPTLETIKNIAEVYGVSVDWLLGLSDEKRNSSKSVSSYSNSVRVLMEMYENGLLEVTDRNVVCIKDPLIIELFNKCISISAADIELYVEWRNTRLSLFDELTLINQKQWCDDRLEEKLKTVSTEIEWLQLCQLIKK